MEKQTGHRQDETEASDFKAFAAKRIILSAIVILLVIWGLGAGLNSCNPSDSETVKSGGLQSHESQEALKRDPSQPMEANTSGPSTAHQPLETDHGAATTIKTEGALEGATAPTTLGAEPPASTDEQPHAAAQKQADADALPDSRSTAAEPRKETTGHDQPAKAPAHTAEPDSTRSAIRPTGVAFV
jgi:hypothetical protein